jgi:hypothetical protein
MEFIMALLEEKPMMWMCRIREGSKPTNHTGKFSNINKTSISFD